MAITAFTREKLVLFPFDSSKRISWYLQKTTCESPGSSLPTAVPMLLKHTVYKAYQPSKHHLCSKLTTKRDEEVVSKSMLCSSYLLSSSGLFVLVPWEAFQPKGSRSSLGKSQLEQTTVVLSCHRANKQQPLRRNQPTLRLSGVHCL